MSPDIYDILREQDKTLARIEENQKATHERLFGDGGLQSEVKSTTATVTRHSKQLAYWKGALAVLTLIWTAAVAVGAAILRHH